MEAYSFFEEKLILSNNSSPNSSILKQKNILVVDDEPNFLFGVSRLLRRADFNVTTATTGPGGIIKANAEVPDLILMDINLPGMSGFEARKVLLQNPKTKHIPVAFLTANSDRSFTLRGLELGEDYITKPFDPVILVARCESILRGQELPQKKAREELKDFRFTTDFLPAWAQAIEIHDHKPLGSTLKITLWCVALARSLGISGEDLENVRKGAMLHDLGKLAIPDKILIKLDSLTDSEKKVIRQHPKTAVEMLLPIVAMRSALEIPFSHHEYWDGTGYPSQLKGEAIPLAARIFGLVKFFVTLCSQSDNHEAIDEIEAKEIVSFQGGKQFDPKIVAHFLVNFDSLKTEVIGG